MVNTDAQMLFIIPSDYEPVIFPGKNSGENKSIFKILKTAVQGEDVQHYVNYNIITKADVSKYLIGTSDDVKLENKYFLR